MTPASTLVNGRDGVLGNHYMNISLNSIASQNGPDEPRCSSSKVTHHSRSRSMLVPHIRANYAHALRSRCSKFGCAWLAGLHFCQFAAAPAKPMNAPSPFCHRLRLHERGGNATKEQRGSRASLVFFLFLFQWYFH